MFSLLFTQHVSALAGHHQVLLPMPKLLTRIEYDFNFGGIIYQTTL
jgi:hypothetical protein